MKNRKIGNLILNRSPGTSINIGNDIVVTFLGLDEFNNARIRISAPKDMHIGRGFPKPEIEVNVHSK